jgi:hypothetical protein
MRFEDFDGDGYYMAESGGVSVLVNTKARQIEVHMSAPDASDHDLAEAQRLLGSLGLSFPGSGAELACGIEADDLGAFTVGADRGVWQFTAGF